MARNRHLPAVNVTESSVFAKQIRKKTLFCTNSPCNLPKKLPTIFYFNQSFLHIFSTWLVLVFAFIISSSSSFVFPFSALSFFFAVPFPLISLTHSGFHHRRRSWIFSSPQSVQRFPCIQILQHFCLCLHRYCDVINFADFLHLGDIYVTCRDPVQVNLITPN